MAQGYRVSSIFIAIYIKAFVHVQEWLRLFPNDVEMETCFEDGLIWRRGSFPTSSAKGPSCGDRVAPPEQTQMQEMKNKPDKHLGLNWAPGGNEHNSINSSEVHALLYQGWI